MNGNPIISVVMPVRNGERYIRNALDSLKRQTFRDFETIIINDDSSDNTVPIIVSYKDKSIRLIHNNSQLGLAKTRQKGIEHVKGQYVAFLDSDDIAMQDRLSRQVDFLEKHGDISLVGSWVSIIDEDGEETGKTWKHASSPNIISPILLFRNCISQSSVTMRRSCFQHFKFRDAYWAAPDYDLWTLLARKYKLANIPDILVQYRIYSSNMSGRQSEEIVDCIDRIMKENITHFGINPTEEELRIHRSLEPCEETVSLGHLRKIRIWLEKLSYGNRKSKRYDNGVFEELLRDYWFKVCCAGAENGLDIMKEYRMFHSKVNGGFGKTSFLFGMCLMKKSKFIDITSEPWMKMKRFIL